MSELSLYNKLASAFLWVEHFLTLTSEQTNFSGSASWLISEKSLKTTKSRSAQLLAKKSYNLISYPVINLVSLLLTARFLFFWIFLRQLDDNGSVFDGNLKQVFVDWGLVCEVEMILRPLW